MHMRRHGDVGLREREGISICDKTFMYGEMQEMGRDVLLGEFGVFSRQV